jgi:predicted small secreted protein
MQIIKKMKKLLLIIAVLFAIATIAQSCGASRNKNGVGCPSGNPNKPFRS